MTKNLKIEYVSIKEIKPNEYNPKQMTEKEAKDLEKSIVEFGIVDPLIANGTEKRKGIIIGGHQRYNIYQKLKYKEVPVVWVDIPDLEKERELCLRLSKNTGEWNFDALANFDKEMLENVGFDDLDSIFKLNSEEDEFDMQKKYEEIKNVRIKRGEVFLMGSHRLMCGDCTKQEDLKRLMDSQKADMVFCDPPYNMDYKSKKHGGILGDKQPEEIFIDFCVEFMSRLKENLKVGGAYYVCSGYGSYMPFVFAMNTVKLIFANPIVWVKNSLGMGMNDYRHKHEMMVRAKNTPIKKKKKAEPLLYGWNEGKHFFIDVRNEADVWEIDRKATNIMIHPTQKPIALVSRAIRNSSKRGQIILDIFAGSGSTLISAEKEGRKCYAMDLDPKWCEAIMQRWESYVEGTAKKEDK